MSSRPLQIVSNSLSPHPPRDAEFFYPLARSALTIRRERGTIVPGREKSMAGPTFEGMVSDGASALRVRLFSLLLGRRWTRSGRMRRTQGVTSPLEHPHPQGAPRRLPYPRLGKAQNNTPERKPFWYNPSASHSLGTSLCTREASYRTARRIVKSKNSLIFIQSFAAFVSQPAKARTLEASLV